MAWVTGHVPVQPEKQVKRAEYVTARIYGRHNRSVNISDPGLGPGSRETPS